MPESTLRMTAPADADRSFRVACAEIDRRVRAGESHVAETWAGSFADDHDRLVELIFTEFATRQAHGQTPLPRDYYDRFPTLAERLRRMFEVDELLRNDDARAPDEETPTVGPYELKERLGSGGMGVVYRGWHPLLKRNVAIKLLAPLAGEGAHDRFLREARSIASLNHPNVIQLFDVGEQDQQPYMVMEYAAGGSLRERITGHLLPPREAADLLETLSHAVAYAHARGILHRDLKPGNILLVPDEGVDPKTAPYASLRAKVGDFGLATSIDKSTNSLSGTAVGTPSYMAPEQAEGRLPPSPAVDIYALGAVLYECLVGRPPFLGDSATETLLKLGRDEPVPPRQLRREVPADLETICLKCLAKLPGRRYATATALADDLRRFLNGQPIAARPVGRGERVVKFARRRPMLTLAIAASAMALLAALVGWAEFTRRLGDESRATRQQRDRADHARDLAIAGRIQAETERERVTRLLDANREFQYVARVLKADGLRASDPVRARDALQSTDWCPLERRDFLWHLLDASCKVQKWETMAPVGGVNVMAMSGDRKLAVVGAQTGIVGYDTATGAEAFRHEFKTPVSAVAVSPDGKRVFVATADGVVRVCQAGVAREFAREKMPAYCLAFAAETNTLYVGGGRRLAGGFLSAYDSDTGEVRPAPPAERNVVRSLLALPDGKSLLMGMDNGDVAHWEVGPAAFKTRFRTPGLRAQHLARRADGLIAVAGVLHTQVTLWDAAGGKVRDIPTARGVWSCEFSPDGRHLVLAEGNNHVSVVRVEDGEPVTTFRGESVRRPPDLRLPTFTDATLGSETFNQSTAAAFVDDRRLVSASATSAVRGWSLDTALRPAVGPDGPVVTTSLAAGPDPAVGWSFGLDRRLHRVDLATGVLAPVKGEALAHPLTDLTGGERWLLGRGQGPPAKGGAPSTNLVAWRWPEATERDSVSLNVRVTSMSEGPAGVVRLLTREGDIYEWTPFSGIAPEKRGRHPEPEGQGTHVAGVYVTVSANAAARWPEGKPLTATFDGAPRGLEASPDGKWMAVWGPTEDPRRFYLCVWDVLGGGAPRVLETPGSQVLRVAFSPDGRTLAVMNGDLRLRLINVATGETLAALPTTEDRSLCRGIAFTPDGKGLVVLQSHGKSGSRVHRWGAR